MNLKGVFAPEDISITQNVRPLSVGTIQYDTAVCEVDGLDFVQVFLPGGGHEYYRVKTAADQAGGFSTRAMEHSIVWLEDYICTEKVTFEGTVEELLEKLLSYASETRWRLGNVEHTEQVKCELNYTNVMQGVMDALDLCGEKYGYVFDQTGEEWIINLVLMPENAECEGRLSRNIINAVVNVDYRDFATRLYVPGKTWHMDSDSQSVWGVRENILNVDGTRVEDEELREQCRKYFADNSNPKVSVQVEAHELGRITGQEFDWFTPGKMCRLCLVDYNGAVVTERVTARTYPSLLRTPEMVVLTMANKVPSASGAINGLSVNIKTLATKTETKLEAFHAETTEMGTTINNLSIRLDAEAAKIALKAEQTYVDEAIGVVVTDVGARFDAMNKEFELYVKSGDVISAINAVPGNVKIISSKIDLEGYVTAEELAATNAEIANLTAGYTRANWIRAENLDASIMADLAGMRLAGTTTKWETVSFLTGNINISQSKRYLTVRLADGGEATLDIVTDVSLSGYSAASRNFVVGSE